MIAHQQLEDLRAQLIDWVQSECEVGSLAEAEQLAEQLARLAGGAVVAATLPALARGDGKPGSYRVCECGGRAKFVNWRERGVATLYGEVRVSRAYYHCSACGRGQLPWDEREGLNRRRWTPRVKSVVAAVAGQLAYEPSVSLLWELLGVEIDDSTADEIVWEVGGRLRAAEAQLMAQCDCGEIAPLSAEAPKRLYVGMDGTSAHIDGGWHEVKTGAVYRATPGEDGIDRCGDRCYVAAQEPAEAFGERLYVAAAQAGVAATGEVVVIGDGAEWIWNLAAHHFPGATPIVDYWHACEHIHALARAVYGEGSARGERWARDHCRRLKARGPTPLLRALRRMRPGNAEQAEAIRLELRYFDNNRARMQYGQLRARGLMIGSGPVEAACKTVVGARLKQSGMRWAAAGADALLAVRTATLSGHSARIQQAARAA